MKPFFHILYTMPFFISVLIISGCFKDSNLNVDNLAAVSGDATFASEATADLFLNDVYLNLPDLNNNIFDPFDNWSDNGMCGFDWTSTTFALRDMANTLNASSDVGLCTSGDAVSWMYWYRLYLNVRKCNVYIQGVQSSTTLSQDYKNKRLGEVYTIRAYFYQLLWQFFGGVPLISRPDSQTTEGDSVMHPRATSDETYHFIIADLDSAIQLLLPNTGNTGGGRVTQGAALTLKGWVQLVYASPLHNTDNDASRWAAAAATNKQVMEMGYSLYPKYDELFLATGNNNNEGIFYQEYLTNTKPSNIIFFQGPQTAGTLNIAWGGANPTQDLVDDYAMANGKAIGDAGSGYDPNNPYASREPRFYQSILYSGSIFDNLIFTTYTGQLNNVSANNPIDLSDGNDITNTGYALRKRIDTTSNFLGGVGSSQNYYYFRYADVLLNYAEAENEAAGPDASVYAALDEIRARAGVPTISDVYPGVSQNAMRDIIHRERRIELAFEDKRYWDLLRWKIAEVNLNHPEHAMHIIANGNSLSYSVIDAPRGERSFDASKNYVLPIPQDVLSQNPKLVQNPGY